VSGRALRRLERPRLYEQVVHRLLEHVNEAGLRPGQRLPPERVLADTLGVSRTSVRQAMVALEVEGIVEVRHGDGTYLMRSGGPARPLGTLLGSHRQLEVVEVREALEVKIAELAARRRTAQDLDTINQAVERMAADLAEGGDGGRFGAEFHAAVTLAAHNALMAELVDRLSEPLRCPSVGAPSESGQPAPSSALAGHRRIADAVRRAEPKAAAAAMRAHLDVVDAAAGENRDGAGQAARPRGASGGSG
jgi:GntR family transcriptional repressor for pyruvate dehydrogenase complex